MSFRPCLVRPAYAAILILASGRPAVAQQTEQTSVPAELPSREVLPDPIARVPVYYAPEPPGPGGDHDGVALLREPGWSAPPELGAFIGEPFYAPLGTRLVEKSLSRKMRAQIEKFRAEGERFAAAIRSGAGVDDAALRQREVEAERIRAELIEDDIDWDTYRAWWVGDTDAPVDARLSQLREFQVLRAAVYFRDGLSPAHRRLLSEYVFQMSRAGKPAAAVPVPAVGPGATVYFFPETSRIVLPVPLQKALADELKILVEAKHALQREIAEAVIATDLKDRVVRRQQLEQLAERHAPRILALEQTAEKIRVRLAAHPVAASSLPPEVTAAAKAYREARDQLRDDALARLQALRAKHLTYQPGVEMLEWSINFVPGSFIPAGARDPQRLGGFLVETQLQRARPAAMADKLSAELKSFNAAQAERIKDVETKRARLFTDAARALYPARANEHPLPREIAVHVARALQADEVRAWLAEHPDYAAATLKPGLSAEARRVLFNAAVGAMRLPLPPGLRRPVGLHNAP